MLSPDISSILYIIVPAEFNLLHMLKIESKSLALFCGQRF